MSRGQVFPGPNHHRGFLGQAYRNFLGLTPESDEEAAAIRAPRVDEYAKKIARGEKLFEPGRCDRCAWWHEVFGTQRGI
jgi:hypothetical protein